MLAGALAAGGIVVSREGLLIIAVLFVLVVPFEKLFPRHRGQRVRRPGLATDLAYTLSRPVVDAAGLVVALVIGVVSLAWLPGLALRPVVAALDPTVHVFVGFVLFDLAGYWTHRWGHEVPALWRFHAIHHSSERMDWISGLRLHPLDYVLAAPPFFFLLGAGFTGTQSGVIVVVNFVAGLFAHANVRWRLRPLRAIVATPEFHHWHHANQPEAINHNYSALLPIWDVLFGTFHVPAESRPQVYGVAEPIPDGLWAQLMYPLRDNPKPWTIVRHPWHHARTGARALRGILRSVWRSTTRPTRRPRGCVGSR